MERTLFGLLALALALVGAQTVEATLPHYLMTVVPLTDSYSAITPFYLNNNGDVVGYDSRYSTSVLYHGGATTLLNSNVYCINDNLEMGGSISDYEGQYATFISSSGETTQITSTGGRWSQAYGMSNSSQVVGSGGKPWWEEGRMFTDGYDHAFLWQSGDTSATYMGGDNQTSVATSINASGQIVGTASNSNGGYDAVLWSPTESYSTPRTISDVGYNLYSSCLINDNGQIAVGGALWQVDANLQITQSAAIGQDFTATGLNNQGVVAGYSSDGAAKVWESGSGLVDLSSLVLNLPGGSSLVLTVGGGTPSSASAWKSLNEEGQILAAYDYGYGSSAVLLTPVMPGDANGDGTVDIEDLSNVLTNYDKSGMSWSQGDFNGDGTVNISDLSNVLTNYDKTMSSAAGIRAVPEPSALAILAAGLVGLIAYASRKRR